MKKSITCMVCLLLLCCASASRAQTENPVEVTFTVNVGCLAEELTSGGVFVQGDFNSWTPCDPNHQLTFTPITGNRLYVGNLSFDAGSSTVQAYQFSRLGATDGCNAESPIRTFTLQDAFPQQYLPVDLWNNETCCEPGGPDEITTEGSYCIHLCFCDTPLSIPIISPYDPPILSGVTFASGCNYGIDGCSEDCDPGTGNVGWGQRVDATGQWFMDLCLSDYDPAAVEGCFCMTIDNILPVEFGSFSAIPADNSVILNWNTLSENDNSRFDIERDGNTIAQIPSQGDSPNGHHYSFVDESVSNGVTYFYRLFDVNLNGDRHQLAAVNATPQASVATEYKLFGNYPNPFNPATNIRYSLAEATHVSLNVFDLSGRLVRELVNGTESSGLHDVVFNASDLPSGIYYYRLTAGAFSDADKMILMK